MSTADIRQLETLALKLTPTERAELALRLTGASTTKTIAQPSLRDHRPSSVGRVLKPLDSNDDFLDEMSHS